VTTPEELRFIAIAAFPWLEEAETKVATKRRNLVWYGLGFPVLCTMWMGMALVALLSLDFSFLDAADDIAPRARLKFHLAAVPLGVLPPLGLVGGLVSTLFGLGPLAEVHPSTILWSFAAIQVCIGIGFGTMAHRVWATQLSLDGGVWLKLDKTVHELGLEDRISFSFESMVESRELMDTLARLRIELEGLTVGDIASSRGASL